MKQKINVFWFRRDLRLEDNHALFLALQKGNVLPIFIFDTTILNDLPKCDARVTFIYKQLKKLHVKCQKFNSALKVYYGQPSQIWKEIINEYEVQNVYANEDYEPYAIGRDQKVAKILNQQRILFHLVKDQVIFAKNEILKKDQLPYTVYTPYKKQWLLKFETGKIKTYLSSKLLGNLLTFKESFPSIESIGFQKSTILVKNIDVTQLEKYDESRDYPALDATSYASVHLRFGTVSIRKMVALALTKNAVWLSELIWREFFMQIMYHFPKVVTQSFKSKYDVIIWRNNEEEFKKWCAGETGFPLVDAGMRQLNKTGYMHNRVRMVCASFLCKHLLIDWRWGEAYFASKLLDYDLALNNGNWQWVAGTGCDAAPYFRIFNPITQQAKFDKQLVYSRIWIEDFDELTYPLQMVNHAKARERCLAHYKKYLDF